MRRLVLSERDARVVRTVKQLRHVTSRQIHDLIFNTASRTPSNDSLTRLVKLGYLQRSKQYSPVGGGGHYIYRLARLGHEFASDDIRERFEPARHNVDHSLAIGECVVTLYKLERAGELQIVGIDVEQDTPIGGVKLKPDLYAFLARPDGQHSKFWFEVDLATEGPKRLFSKLKLYTRAFNNYTDRDFELWPEFPLVVWVTLDEDRADRLKMLIGDLPEDDRAIFRVTTFDGLYNFLAT